MLGRILAFAASLLVTPAFAGGIALLGAGKPAAGGALACSYTPVTTGTQGTAYTGATPSASGGSPAYTFSETGSLPTGITISSSTGVLSGTPSVSGSFPTVQVKVTDSLSATANCGSAFTLTISPSGGGVTVDVVGTATGQAGAAATNQNLTPITISAGLTNPALVCFILRAHASFDVTAGLAVTWNGVAMTLIKSQNAGANTNAVSIWGLRNPASGAKTLNVMATNASTDGFVNCVSFSNVNQTSDAAAFPNPTGTTSAASINVTSASGHIAVGVFDNLTAIGTIIPTIVINDSATGFIIAVGADYVASSGASTTVGSSTTMSAIAGMDISN